MKKVLATLLFLVTFAVAAFVPNVFDGHGEETMFSASTVYASANGDRLAEEIRRIVEGAEKDKRVWITCEYCHGSGQCGACGGSGQVTMPGPDGLMSQPCYGCGGMGRCSSCGGNGGRYYP